MREGEEEEEVEDARRASALGPDVAIVHNDGTNFITNSQSPATIKKVQYSPLNMSITKLMYLRHIGLQRGLLIN